MGTIDSDYRGETAVTIHNNKLEGESFEIKKGDRIAQMLIARTEPITMSIVDNLSVTKRGDGGWGSTGIRTNN